MRSGCVCVRVCVCVCVCVHVHMQACSIKCEYVDVLCIDMIIGHMPKVQ